MRRLRTVRGLRACFAGPRRAALLGALLALGVMLPIWWQAGLWYRGRELASRRSHVATELASYGNALSTSVNQRLALLEGLEAFARAEIAGPHVNMETEFEAFARGIVASAHGVRSVSIAPGGVQRYVYPLAGNESVPGHDLLHDERPDVRADVQRALQAGQVILSGPYALGQGGPGLVACKAIYQGDAFWGLVAMALDVPPILEETGLQPPPAGLALALRDDSGQVFHGPSTVFDNEPLLYGVELPEGTWELAATPGEGWEAAIREPVTLVRGTGLAIVVLLACVAYLVTNHQARLTWAVRQRTEALNQELAQRRRAEEALRRTEQEKAAILDNMSELVVYQDIDMRILWANRAAGEADGLAPEQLVGRSCYEVWEQRGEPCVGCPVVKARRTGQPQAAEVTARDGRAWLVRGNPVRDVNGDVVGIVEVTQEITERVRAEEALRRYAERLSILREIDRAILEVQSPETIAQATLRHIRQLVPCQRVSVTLFDFEAYEAMMLAVDTAGETSLGKGACVPLESFKDVIEVLQQGKVHMVEDFLALPQPHPAIRSLQAEGLRSAIRLPLIVHGELTGALSLGSAEPGAFAEEQIEIAGEVAGPLAIAIQQARLHEQVQRHAAELEQRVRERTAELRKFVNLMAGREVRMAELKDVIRELRAQLEEAGLTPVADDPLAAGREG